MADEKVSPLSAANSGGKPAGAQAPTLKLKPVIRKPTIGGAAARPGLKLPTAAKPVAPAAPAAAPAPAASAPESTISQLQSVTQKLKGLTQQIPQQAILHKTGIIAEQALTEAQKQASKSRTARISLSEAIGVAPVKEASPMKTIRIKRPTDVQNPAAPAAEAPAEAPAADATLTQRKTLKIARPGGGVRPAGKFGAKKPAPATPPAGEVANLPEVADIPDLPPVAPMAPVAANECPPDRIPDVAPGLQLTTLLFQIAACTVMGFLAWKLYEVTQTPAYTGGLLM